MPKFLGGRELWRVPLIVTAQGVCVLRWCLYFIETMKNMIYQGGNLEIGLAAKLLVELSSR